jgi:ABC-type transport system involved in multi-copper enzyme maturation permease subunit
VSTGGIRYALFRADRLDWALGKLAGQALLMAVGIGVGGLAAFILGASMLNTFEAGPTFWWIVVMCGRSLFYGFAYLGVALCASQLVRSNAGARAIGIGLMFALVVGGSIVQARFTTSAAPELMNVLKQVFPNAHSLKIFHPSLSTRLPSMLALTFIGAAFFSLGFLRFSKRDT